MNSKLEEIYSLLDNKNYSLAVTKVNVLRKNYPKNIAVLLAWCEVAQRVRKIQQTIPTLMRELTNFSQPLQKALICERLSRACMINKADVPLSALWISKAFRFLTFDLQQQKFPTHKKEKPVDFNVTLAEKLMWNVLIKFRAENIKATIAFGTLLALAQQNSLFKKDKDLDFICEIKFLEVARRILVDELDFVQDITLDFDNVWAFVHKGSGITLDLMGVLPSPENGKTVGGFWIENQTPNWQIVMTWPRLAIVPKTIKQKDVYWLEEPVTFLKSQYGPNWQKSDPSWITFLDDFCLSDTDLRLFYVKIKILRFWFNGEFEKTKNALQKANSLFNRDMDIADAYLSIKQVKRVSSITKEYDYTE